MYQKMYQQNMIKDIRLYSQNLGDGRSMTELRDNVNLLTCLEYERMSGCPGDSGVGF